MTDSFHETTITCKHKSVVVHEICAKSFAKVALSYGHTDGIGETLAQRTRCNFNTIRVSCLWVSRSLGVPLAKRFDVFNFETIAIQKQHRILQN